jgi:FkbM family methyltransferase
MIAPLLKNGFKKLSFSLSASNSFLYKGFYKWFYKPKKGSLAEIIDLFSTKTGAVNFLQVGANDGFFHDPLHKFIRIYNWKGVLLEPQPFVFEKYLKRLYKGTRDIQTVNAAMASDDGFRNIYKISFSTSRWATGLASFNKSAIEKAIDSGHVGRCASRHGEKLPAHKKDFIAEETINCISPETLIQKYGLHKIDWLQIDAEGYDFEIIKMMKIEKTTPRVIVYEHSHLSADDQATCIDHLTGNNYAVTGIKENTIAMRKPLGEFERFFSK